MKTNIAGWKKIIQWCITICLVISLGVGICNVWKIESNSYENILQSQNVSIYEVLELDLIYGEYGELVDYYILARHVHGTEEMSKPKYDRFREFIEFYDFFIEYTKYTAYDEQNNTEKYVDECTMCIEKMQEITANSQFKKNAPYYQDILNKVNGE